MFDIELPSTHRRLYGSCIGGYRLQTNKRGELGPATASVVGVEQRDPLTARVSHRVRKNGRRFLRLAHEWRCNEYLSERFHRSDEDHE